MATVTPGKIFTANEIVTPTNLNALGVPTISNIVTADLVDANVTTAKIADANITTAKIADGAVTQSKLNSSVTLVPTGAVMPFAMNSAPSGWLAADGTAVSRTTYAALFAAIGTIYGTGNGSSTFNLPDLRGYFVRGAGTNSDGTASGAFGTKQSDSYKSHNHGGITGSGTTGNESQGHSHSGTTGSESADHAHYVSGTTGTDYPDHNHGISNNTTNFDTYSYGPINLGGVYNQDFTKGSGAGGYVTYSAGASNRHQHDFAAWTGGRNQGHTHNFTTNDRSASHTHSVPSLSISSDGETETRPKNIALLYCIKF